MPSDMTGGGAPTPMRILITGGTSGIGLAAALRLATPGARIVLNGRDPDRGAAACEAVRQRCAETEISFVAADVTTRDGVARLFDGFPGQLDVLVTAAGGESLPTLFHETTLDQVDAMVRGWLLATLYCCSAGLPRMADGGAIVTVASDAAKVPTPGESVIGAAMAGIAMFSRTLAMEAKRRRIRVNVVTPSLVSGTLTTARITAGGFSARLFERAAAAARLGVATPDDVAVAIEFLAGPGAARMTGQVISVNGGISAG